MDDRVCVVASCNMINSSIEKDRLSMFYKIVRVGSNPSLQYFLGGKDGGYRPLGDASCVLSLSF